MIYHTVTAYFLLRRGHFKQQKVKQSTTVHIVIVKMKAPEEITITNKYGCTVLGTNRIIRYISIIITSTNFVNNDSYTCSFFP